MGLLCLQASDCVYVYEPLGSVVHAVVGEEVAALKAAAVRLQQHEGPMLSKALVEAA